MKEMIEAETYRTPGSKDKVEIPGLLTVEEWQNIFDSHYSNFCEVCMHISEIKLKDLIF